MTLNSFTVFGSNLIKLNTINTITITNFVDLNHDYFADSWVVFNQEGGDGNRPHSIYNGNMEKLLMEAQRESRSTSRGSSQGGRYKTNYRPSQREHG